jgi:AAHS family 4-hydroxybenzoate transporter-like MFS transporter
MTQRQTIDVGQIVDNQKITKFIVMIVFLSFLVMMSDGFDLQTAALAGPGLVQAWGVERAALATMFSASLFGMMVGAPVLSFFADKYGRKPAIIASALLCGLTTLSGAWATNLDQLVAARFMTGIGLGGLMPIVIAYNAEFAPKRVRATLLFFVNVGLTVGSILPSAVTAHLGHNYNWQTLFIVGGIVPLIMAAILFLFLPESVKFLAVQKKSPQQMARLLTRMQPGLAIEPNAEFVLVQEVAEKVSFPVKRLFTNGLAFITLAIWLLSIINLFANYFVKNWTPVLFRDAGLSVEQMGIATGIYDFGGIFGAFLMSRLLDKFGAIPLFVYFAMSAFFMAAVGTPGLPVPVLDLCVALTGFCLVGNQLGLLATAGIVYPTEIRANGGGWATMLGRIGGILGTTMGAYLIAQHFTMQQMFIMPAVPLGIGAVTAFALMLMFRQRFGRHCLDDRRVERLADVPAVVLAPAGLPD